MLHISVGVISLPFTWFKASVTVPCSVLMHCTMFGNGQVLILATINRVGQYLFITHIWTVTSQSPFLGGTVQGNHPVGYLTTSSSIYKQVPVLFVSYLWNNTYSCFQLHLVLLFITLVVFTCKLMHQQMKCRATVNNAGTRLVDWSDAHSLSWWM